MAGSSPELISGRLIRNEQEGACTVAVADDSIVIYPDTGELIAWSRRGVTVRESAFSFSVYYHDEHVTFEGADAARIKARWNKPDSSAKQKGHFTTAALLIIGSVGLLITILVVVAVYALLPKLADKAANMIPVGYEMKLGESIAAQYEAQQIADDSLNIFLDRFVAGLKFESSYPIKVRVIDSDEINAFAVPGGRIFIYSGLLEKMDGYEELVALLGHEATHVIKRHSLRSLLSAATTGVVISTMLGNNSGLTGWALSEADQLKQLDYSRDLETEADSHGLYLMTLNHVDPHGMLKLMNILKRESVEEPGLMKYLSTHPDTDARIQSIEASPALNSTFQDNIGLESLFGKIKMHLSPEDEGTSDVTDSSEVRTDLTEYQ